MAESEPVVGFRPYVKEPRRACPVLAGHTVFMLGESPHSQNSKIRIAVVGALVIALGVAALYLGRSGDLRRESTQGQPTSGERREAKRLEAVLRGARQSPLPVAVAEDLRLDLDAFFYVRVLDGEGRIAPNVKLTYAVGRRPDLRLGSAKGVRGWYALERAELASPLHVKLEQGAQPPERDGLAPTVLRDVDFTQAVLEVTLAEARVLHGLVVDTKGVPQPDVQVGAFCYGLVLTGQHVQGQLGKTRTDEEGAFAFSGLPWLPMRLDLTTDIAFQRTMKFEVSARQMQCHLEVPATRRLICRVHDPDGNPVEDAYLYVVAGVGEGRWMATGKTNAEGQEEVRGLRPGEELRLTIRKYKSLFQPCIMEIRDPELEVVDAQLETGVAIEGEVVLPPGCEAGEIHVFAIPRGPWNIAATRSHRLAAGETRFRVEGLAPGPHTVIVGLGNGEPESAPFGVIAPATNLRLQVSASREIHGAVTGHALGNLFGIWTDGTRQLSVGLGKGGRFRFRIPVDTDGVVYVGCDPNAFYSLRPVGPADSGALRLSLKEGVRISGSVEDATGAPYVAANVRLRAGKLLVIVRCDAAGKFVTPGLPEGEYEVIVDGGGGPEVPAQTVRAPAENVRLRVP